MQPLRLRKQRIIVTVAALGAGLISVIALGAATPTRAHAAESGAAGAETALKRGLELRRAGADEAALVEFRKAQDLNPTPRGSAQLGMCEQAVGLWVDAEEHLTTALRSGSDAWISRNRATLEQSLSEVKKHVARLEITADVPGAQVFVAGKPLGSVPLAAPVRVNAGPVDVQIRAPGFATTARTVQLTGGQYLQVAFHLEPEARNAVPVAPQSPPAPASALSPSVSASSDGSAESATEARPFYRRPWFWVAVGVVVAAGVGTGVALAAKSDSPPADQLTIR